MSFRAGGVRTDTGPGGGARVARLTLPDGALGSARCRVVRARTRHLVAVGAL